MIERVCRAPKLVFLHLVSLNKVQGNKVQLSSLSRYSPYYHIKGEQLRCYSLPLHVQVVHRHQKLINEKTPPFREGWGLSGFNASLAMERCRRAPPLVTLCCRTTRPDFHTKGMPLRGIYSLSHVQVVHD